MPSPSPALLSFIALTLTGCGGVGLYVEGNGGWMHATRAPRDTQDAPNAPDSPGADDAPNAAATEDSARATDVWTWGFAVGVDFEFAMTSYVALGVVHQFASMDDRDVGLTDVELFQMSTVPALTTRVGRGVLAPRAALGIAWNNDERRLFEGFAGLGASYLADAHSMLTFVVGATLGTWQMGAGEGWNGAGVLGRLRYTWTGSRKERSR